MSSNWFGPNETFYLAQSVTRSLARWNPPLPKRPQPCLKSYWLQTNEDWLALQHPNEAHAADFVRAHTRRNCLMTLIEWVAIAALLGGAGALTLMCFLIENDNLLQV